ncbi:MAG: hypothetical protein IKW93_03075 [Bacteroidales bacterium]|nr:hypothetical protein [Bacteroidales bacterium]
MMCLITPSERGRARSATTLSPHCAPPPHCAAAPLVWCFLRLTARLMPPAWCVSSHLLREAMHAVSPLCHHTVTSLRSVTTLRGCAAGMVFPAPDGAFHASGMVCLITPSERDRVRSAITLPPHYALPPHCAAAPLVWCFLRLTARFMPPAWCVSSHIP